MRKMDAWHVVWIGVLFVGVLLLALSLAVAVQYRENTAFVNVAGIWGLFVGLIGFAVTIYTLFETQRVSRKAQHEISAATLAAQERIEEAAKQAEAAVKAAQEYTRRVLERVSHGMREADFLTLQMWVRELRTAAGRGDWQRALFIAEESPAVAERLRNAEGLEDAERDGLREGADNMRLIQAHIRNTRLDTQTLGLAPGHAKSLEALTTLLERLRGRLHHEPTKGGMS